MRKALAIIATAVLAVGMFGAPVAAKDHGPDVWICHLPNANDTWELPNGDGAYASFGKWDLVGAKAAEKHVANHGDGVFQDGLTEWLWPADIQFLRDKGVKVEDWSNCFVVVIPEV